MASFFEATSVTGQWSFRGGGCGKQRMDALRRRVSHGWLNEPGSNPRPGTAPSRRPDQVACNPADSPRMREEPFFSSFQLSPESEKNQRKGRAVRGLFAWIRA